MAHDFPEITGYGAALRFALEAEQACADFAAAAGVLAPTQEWQDKLEEIVCTHDDRVQKLMAKQGALGAKASAPAGTLRGGAVPGHPGRGAGDRAGRPPCEQLAEAEEDAARYHEEFAMQCADELELDARAVRQDGAAGPRRRGRAARAARLAHPARRVSGGRE